MSGAKTHASFMPPMLLLSSQTLPEGRDWLYELKLDGYRALALKTRGKVQLRSRNDNDFTARYRHIAEALKPLPNETVIDGELVAFDTSGRPSFNALQNYGSSSAPVFYYIFDLLVLAGNGVTREPLEVRRALLETKILPKLTALALRPPPVLEGTLENVLHVVRTHGLEGLIAKRRDSVYESGQRSGVWRKMRVHQGQEFVIGGYTPSCRSFDALIFGYYDSGKLMYAARTRNGFTPRVRRDVFAHVQELKTMVCPFANLPEESTGRWGQGLTVAKMVECRWVRPVLVGQFEFVEWTPDNHLRHSRFVGLRLDKDPDNVTRE
jgi:DNA ligase D-like protein (predicted ligase)